jgi:hypothetical protein
MDNHMEVPEDNTDLFTLPRSQAIQLASDLWVTGFLSLSNREDTWVQQTVPLANWLVVNSSIPQERPLLKCLIRTRVSWNPFMGFTLRKSLPAEF